MKCIIQRQVEKRKHLNIHAAVSSMKLIIRIHKERIISLNKNLYLQSSNDDVFHKKYVLTLLITDNAINYSVTSLPSLLGRPKS
jgi:hypothetical protein